MFLNWTPKPREAKLVGYSPLHASSVGMIRNLNTHHVSPQSHVMYDDFFETVHCSEGNPPPKQLWENSSIKQKFIGSKVAPITPLVNRNFTYIKVPKYPVNP